MCIDGVVDVYDFPKPVEERSVWAPAVSHRHDGPAELLTCFRSATRKNLRSFSWLFSVLLCCLSFTCENLSVDVHYSDTSAILVCCGLAGDAGDTDDVGMSPALGSFDHPWRLR